MEKQLQDFCERWIRKAEVINEDEISDRFDKFFSLYVVYNRLYTEVTHILNDSGPLDLDEDKSFPDAQAATSYVIQFLGCKTLENELKDKEINSCIESLQLILEKRYFNICLNPITGYPKHDKDRELLVNLKSNSCNEKFTSVLKFIYEVRCNMFHGRKGYEPVQALLLEPTTKILHRLVLLLFRELKRTSE